VSFPFPSSSRPSDWFLLPTFSLSDFLLPDLETSLPHACSCFLPCLSHLSRRAPGRSSEIFSTPWARPPPRRSRTSGRAWRTCSGSSRSCSCGRRHRPAAHRCVPRVCSPHHHSLPPFSPGGQSRRGRPVPACCVRVPVCLAVLPDLETYTAQIVFSSSLTHVLK